MTPTTPTPELVALLELSDSELIAKLLEALKDCVRAMDIARDTIQPLTMSQLKLHNLDPQTDAKLDAAALKAIEVIGIAVVKAASTRAATVPQGVSVLVGYTSARDIELMPVLGSCILSFHPLVVQEARGDHTIPVYAATTPPPAELGRGD